MSVSKNTHHHRHHQHHHARISLSVFISSWRGTETHFLQEPQFLAFSNRRKYLERWLVMAMKCPPGASETFLIWDKMVYNNERHQNKESCTAAKQEFTHVGTLQLMKVRSLCTLNSWQDPLKARALVYQFAFNITKMRRHALQRSGVFYLASKLPPSQPTPLFSPFKPPPPISLSFQVWSKGLRKHMQSIAPLKREQVIGFVSECLILYPVSRLSFPRLWKKHPSRLVYTLNKPVLTKQGGKERM